MWTHCENIDLHYGFALVLQYMPNTLAKYWIDANLLQSSTGEPINGLSILWTMGWLLLSLLNTLLLL